MRAERPSRRLRALDGLRGLAVLMVVLYHYSSGYEHVVGPHRPGLLFRFPAGQYGVNLFFMISGYAILMTTERGRGVRAFVLARLIRLYPPFLCAMLFTGAILCVSGFNPRHVTGMTMQANTLMATYLLGIRPVDSVYWTLSYEVIFYALITIALLMLRVRVELTALAWLTVAYGVKFILHVPAPPAHHPAFALPVVTGSEVAYLFVAGMMIRRLHANRSGPARTRWLAWGVLALCAVPAVLPLAQALRGWNAASPDRVLFTVLTLSFAGLITAVRSHPITLLVAGPLPFLGDISYSLYLVHQMAGYWVIALLEARHVDPNLAALIAFGLAIGVAALMREMIEIRLQRVLRRFLPQG